MSRSRSAFREFVDRVLADPEAAVEGIKRYARDVKAGADPIEVMHGHVCSKDCWHQQLKKAGKSR